jgi:ribose/xylose/arabinose/galactoside ABC-type transport system permease subunit
MVSAFFPRCCDDDPGIMMGTMNGFLVMKLRITPVIATLVTLNLL